MINTKISFVILMVFVLLSIPTLAMQVGKSGDQYTIRCDSHSMDLDCKQNYPAYYPKNRNNISIGTICIYSNWQLVLETKSRQIINDIPTGYTLHRISEVGYDNKGIFYIFKGDNHVATDFDIWNYKVRPRHIMVCLK